MSRNAVLYALLRAAHVLMRVLPVAAAYRLADLAGIIAFYTVPAARRAVLGNLRVVCPDIEPTELRALATEVFRTDTKNWIDTLRIGRVRPAEVLAAMPEVEGWDRLEAAAAEGKGVIMALMHLGNVDLVGHVLIATGYRLTVPAERVQPERLFEFLLAERRKQGINVVPIESGARELVRALRNREIVGVAADRNAAGRTVTVDFFGRPAALPVGPVALARRTGAPILIAVGIRQASGNFHAYVSEPLYVSRTEDRGEDEREGAQRLAGMMQAYVRRFPGQWLVFSPFWPVTASDNAATISRATEVEV